MKQPGPERAVVREHSNFLVDLSERSPADPTGPRFLIEDIFPSVDGGHYPVKRIAGESVDVWADIFREGHDVIAMAPDPWMDPGRTDRHGACGVWLRQRGPSRG